MKDEKQKLVMAVISGASNALKYKERKPSATESEIMSHITKNIREIIAKIDDED